MSKSQLHGLEPITLKGNGRKRKKSLLKGRLEDNHHKTMVKAHYKRNSSRLGRSLVVTGNTFYEKRTFNSLYLIDFILSFQNGSFFNRKSIELRTAYIKVAINSLISVIPE